MLVVELLKTAPSQLW